MSQPPHGMPPGGMPPGGMPPGGMPPGGMPPGGMPPGPGGYPPPGPPQWGGQQPGGPAPQLPPKKGFPWVIVVILGFLVAVGVGGYIYKKQAGNPLKKWEQGIQDKSNSELERERELERMENPEHLEKRMKEMEELNRQMEELQKNSE